MPDKDKRRWRITWVVDLDEGESPEVWAATRLQEMQTGEGREKMVCVLIMPGE